ncbi:MAG: carboxypeptidase regulatory-like domain-containing protein [Blastocatellia bacterium]
MTASVSGQIKIGETPARGVSVALVLNSRQRNPQATTDPATRMTTDADGRYRFTNLAAGSYRVNVLAPGYIVFGTADLVRNGQQVTLKDGEAVERIDFTLTRGGVITGKVVNSNGRPVIGEAVNLVTIDDAGQQSPFNPPGGGGGLRTDDRGVYRAYGLPPGKYLVSAGQGTGGGGGPGFMAASRAYIRTYHPEVTDVSQATPITVEAGKEVTDVDIRLASLETFAAAGRVIDAATGNAVMGVLIGHNSVRGGGRGGQMQAPGGLWQHGWYERRGRCVSH